MRLRRVWLGFGFGLGRGDCEDWRAGHAEGGEERAQGATDGGVGFDEFGHCGVGEEIAELLRGVDEGAGHCFAIGEQAAEPALACGQRGFGSDWGRFADLRGADAARARADESGAGEAGGEAGDALPDLDETGEGDTGGAALIHDDVDQDRDDQVEAAEHGLLGGSGGGSHSGR